MTSCATRGDDRRKLLDIPADDNLGFSKQHHVGLFGSNGDCSQRYKEFRLGSLAGLEKNQLA